MWFDEFKSPIGKLRVAVDERGLRYVLFDSNKHPPKHISDWLRDCSPTRQAREQLLQYFAGEIKTFELAISFDGTEFQQRTWNQLASIPYGKTWSYSDLAIRVGSPKAVRAVGSANGRNPIPIVLPCHRFGGGLPIKKWLLEHEGVRLDFA